MFNERRGGEASKLLSESYLHRPNWKPLNNPEIMSTLSGFERELSRRQVRFTQLRLGRANVNGLFYFIYFISLVFNNEGRSASKND